MSERLVFELQAIDRATAPLKAVQAQVGATAKVIDAASGSINRFGSATTAVDRATQRWAKGALQQAGYQVGDFAVQLANGTSGIQAFGQQGSQLLGIFGPIGAVLGAVVAVASAVGVAFTRATGEANGFYDAATRQILALDMLGDAIDATSKKLDEYRFGGSATAFAENEISKIQAEISGVNNLIQSLTANIENAKTGTALDAALIARDMAQEEISAQQEILSALQSKLQVLQATTEAQNMLNGGLSVASGIQAGLVYDKQVELREAKQLMQEHADQLAYMGKTRQESDNFVNALISAHRLLASSKTIAAGLADEMARAAQSAVDPEKFKMAGAYQLYARTRLAAPDQPISRKEPSGRGAGGGASVIDPLQKLREEIALEGQLIGKTDAQQRVIRALGEDWKKYDSSVIDGLAEQISGMDQLNQIAKQQESIASTIKDAFSGAFMSMVDGTASVKDAFRNMARSIISKLYEVLVVQRIVNGVMGLVGGAFPSLAPYLNARAMGGPVTGGKPVLVGERGPELMVPSRNAQVIPNNKLGGSGVAVTQNITFGSGVKREEIQAMLPKIVEATKAAVFDAQRRSVNGMGY